MLEAIFQREADPTDHRDRVIFVHEEGVTSAMIAAVLDRWDARVYDYTDHDDLVRQVRLFVRDIVRREQVGDLSKLD